MQPLPTNFVHARPPAGTVMLASLVVLAACYAPVDQDLTMVSPVPSSWVAASFGNRQHPLTQVVTEHGGVDLIARRGTSVQTAAAGTVTEAESRRDWGLVVTIAHDGGYTTRYARLGQITVRRGQVIAAGETIGTIGLSGNASQPMLHFEVLHQGVPVDPMTYVRE